MLWPPSLHMQTVRQHQRGPWALLRTAVPIFKQTHPWRQLFSSQTMIAVQQKAHPDQPQCARRVQHIFQAQERGHCSSFSSLCCSPQGQEAVQGQARSARTPLGPASPTGQVLGSWLSAAGTPGSREHSHAELQPDLGREKVTAKPTSCRPSEPAAQTPCQD